ncbi:hypothetical protein DBR29_18385 [Pseudomonas sp. HMWF005]|nr:hypothetical protein DBR29_18385 [Pseudomonas sp. HMWF005]
MDIDHIPSRRALESHLIDELSWFEDQEIANILRRAPSVAIPTEVHRKFSETYGGRNSRAKQLEDAQDLRRAVDANFDALKAGLLEQGLDEAAIDAARLELHDLHMRQGWYK